MRDRRSAAITRPVTVGSATARHSRPGSPHSPTKTAHGRKPPRSPPRESVSSVVDATTIIPSIDDGVSAANPLPAQPDQPAEHPLCLMRARVTSYREHSGGPISYSAICERAAWTVDRSVLVVLAG